MAFAATGALSGPISDQPRTSVFEFDTGMVVIEIICQTVGNNVPNREQAFSALKFYGEQLLTVTEQEAARLIADSGGDGSDVDFTVIDETTARLVRELQESTKDQYNCELFARGVEGQLLLK